MAKITCCNSRFFPIIATLSVFIAAIVPYAIAVTKRNVKTFLPYISHAAAFPPQSAIHSIFLTIGAFFGTLTVFLRFVSVEHRRTKIQPRKVRLLNKTAVFLGVAAFFFLFFTSHFPIAFVTHEKYDWLYTVIVPSFIGTVFMLLTFMLYILTQSYLTYTLRKGSDINVSIHATLALAVVITTWITSLPFYAAIRSIIPHTINRDDGAISLETQEYSFYYIISSLSEWGFMLFTLLFISTFYRDLKRLKISVTLTSKPVRLDTVQSAMQNGSEEMTKM